MKNMNYGNKMQLPYNKIFKGLEIIDDIIYEENSYIMIFKQD